MDHTTIRIATIMEAPIREERSWPALQRARRAIVVADIVESVRLMQQHEVDVIERWRRFVNEVCTQVLPNHGGRLVKSLGDGMLLEFEQIPRALAAAFEMQRRVETNRALEGA
jgi:class 3 adenylate cyclase